LNNLNPSIEVSGSLCNILLSVLVVLSIVLIAAALYGLYRLGLWIYEVRFLTPEERWKRRYDRKLKSYFKQMGG
jgi:hypothetical protein